MERDRNRKVSGNRKPLSDINSKTPPPKKPKKQVLRKGNSKNPGTASSSKASLDDSFENIPWSSDDSPSPPYKYQRGPVRKKRLRAKLPGQTCPCCEKFYEGYDEAERQKMIDAFSKHRDKWPRPKSPQGIWNFDFPTDSDD